MTEKKTMDGTELAREEDPDEQDLLNDEEDEDEMLDRQEQEDEDEEEDGEDEDIRSDDM